MIYKILEYILFPMLAVFLTFMVRAIMSSKRIEAREVIADLGYDVMIMCTFGMMLNTIGAFGELSPTNIATISTYALFGCLIGFVALCILIGTAAYDKSMFLGISDGEQRLNTRCKFLVRIGLGYIITLICFVMFGAYLLRNWPK